MNLVDRTGTDRRKPRIELLARHLNQPLTRVPDPFGTHDSFGAHNNAELRRFLDAFGFDYEFRSATACYEAGIFDDTLRAIAAEKPPAVKKSGSSNSKDWLT